MAKRRTRITVETQSTLIIREVSPMRSWCTRCAAEVNTVVLEAAGVLARVDQSTIERWLEDQDLHETQMNDGLARICLDSLLRSVRRVLPKLQIRNTSKKGDDL